MQHIGIIGGLGPQTTAEIYLDLIQRVKKIHPDTYPAITIHSIPLPYAVEEAAIIEGRDIEKMRPYLLEGAKTLERSGAAFGILPCNTLHLFIQDIRQSTSLPFLSILDETALFLKTQNIARVGILGTQTTADTRLYDPVLHQQEIQTVYPSFEEQRILNQIIIDLLRGETDPLQEKHLLCICDRLREKGAVAVLLACTDLQLMTSRISMNQPLFDTTEILIQACVREMIK